MNDELKVIIQFCESEMNSLNNEQKLYNGGNKIIEGKKEIYANLITKMNMQPTQDTHKDCNAITFNSEIEKLHKDCISKSEVEILRQLIAETDITKEQIYERLLKIAPLPKLT